LTSKDGLDVLKTGKAEAVPLELPLESVLEKAVEARERQDMLEDDIETGRMNKVFAVTPDVGIF